MTSVRFPRGLFALFVLALSVAGARAQVIEYETNGIKYQTATRAGLTVIVTHLPTQVAGPPTLTISFAVG